MESKFLELVQSLQINAANDTQLNILDTQNKSGHWIIDINLNKQANYELNLTSINFNNHNKKIEININLVEPLANVKVNVNCLGLDSSKTEIIINGNGLNLAASGNLNIHVNGVVDSDDAIIIGKPNFNFCTNKINAKHGLIIGNINQQELNYLLSRGIAEKKAKYLLVSTKLFKVLESLDDNIKNQYQHAIMHIWEDNNYA